MAEARNFPGIRYARASPLKVERVVPTTADRDHAPHSPANEKLKFVQVKAAASSSFALMEDGRVL